MPLARSNRDLFDYVLKEDRELPAEQQTVFHLRALSSRVAMRMHTLAQVKPVALLAGVAGWKNFRDAAGNEVVCKHAKGKVIVEGIELDKPLSEESLDYLSPEWCNELAAAVLTNNRLSSDDAKN